MDYCAREEVRGTERNERNTGRREERVVENHDTVLKEEINVVLRDNEDGKETD